MFVLHWIVYFFFFKQKTAYEMRISDWSSDVCSSDLLVLLHHPAALPWIPRERAGEPLAADIGRAGNARVVDHCARDREIEFIHPRLHALRIGLQRRGRGHNRLGRNSTRLNSSH